MSATQPSTDDDVLSRAQQLAPTDQPRLAEQLLMLAQEQIAARQQHNSIIELRGLGKELWDGIDAQEHVDQERDSWER